MEADSQQQLPSRLDEDAAGHCRSAATTASTSRCPSSLHSLALSSPGSTTRFLAGTTGTVTTPSIPATPASTPHRHRSTAAYTLGEYAAQLEHRDGQVWFTAKDDRH